MLGSRHSLVMLADRVLVFAPRMSQRLPHGSLWRAYKPDNRWVNTPIAREYRREPSPV